MIGIGNHIISFHSKCLFLRVDIHVGVLSRAGRKESFVTHEKELL